MGVIGASIAHFMLILAQFGSRFEASHELIHIVVIFFNKSIISTGGKIVDLFVSLDPPSFASYMFIAFFSLQQKLKLHRIGLILLVSLYM